MSHSSEPRIDEAPQSWPERREPGWYRAEGDTAGTERWWDGERWDADVRVMSVAPPQRERWIFAGEYVQLAPIGARFAARVIDTVVVLLGGLIPLWLSTGRDFSLVTRSDLVLPCLIALCLSFVNEVIATLAMGTTPSKAVFGLRTISHSGGAVDPPTAVVRWAAVTLPVGLAVFIAPVALGIAIGVVGLWSLYSMNETPRRRSVHDLAAATLVVVGRGQ